MSEEDATKTEVYLEADKEIPGQHYCCLTFISPNKVLKNKDIHFFAEFLKDYEVQYKIKATETFVMAQVAKVQHNAGQIQDALENLMTKTETLTIEDISGALATVKALRAEMTQITAKDLEAHVRAEMSDFKESKLLEAYETFIFKNKKKLEDDFFAANSFRTTVQGLKVRGVYDTYNEAVARAKTLQKLDPSFNVFVGQVGFWLPWDPEPQDIQNQEYADEQLNTLMKQYKNNEADRDEFYAKTKSDRLAGAKVRSAGAAVGVSAASAAAGESAAPKDMFGAEDLAMARKRERAAETSSVPPTNTILP